MTKSKRMFALLKEAWLLTSSLTPADRALFLLLLTGAQSHLVALSAATPVVSASGRLLAVVSGRIDVLRQASVGGVVVGDDIAGAWNG